MVTHVYRSIRLVHLCICTESPVPTVLGEYTYHYSPYVYMRRMQDSRLYHSIVMKVESVDSVTDDVVDIFHKKIKNKKKNTGGGNENNLTQNLHPKLSTSFKTLPVSGACQLNE